MNTTSEDSYYKYTGLNLLMISSNKGGKEREHERALSRFPVNKCSLPRSLVHYMLSTHKYTMYLYSQGSLF